MAAINFLMVTLFMSMQPMPALSRRERQILDILYAHNGGTGSYPKNSPYALPSGVVAAGESAIVAEVQYEYTPLIFQYFMKSTTPLQETYYLKPRLSTDIKFDGNGCS